jgi:hypothetical protein
MGRSPAVRPDLFLALEGYRPMTSLRSFTAALLASAALALPALADEMTVDRPIAAASLHDGPLDMVAYYMPAENDLKVTATFVGREDGARPMRAVMLLADGDDVSFAMPGHLDALYRFVRNGPALAVSVRRVAETRS